MPLQGPHVWVTVQPWATPMRVYSTRSCMAPLAHIVGCRPPAILPARTLRRPPQGGTTRAVGSSPTGTRAGTAPGTPVRRREPLASVGDLTRRSALLPSCHPSGVGFSMWGRAYEGFTEPVQQVFTCGRCRYFLCTCGAEAAMILAVHCAAVAWSCVRHVHSSPSTIIFTRGSLDYDSSITKGPQFFSLY